MGKAAGSTRSRRRTPLRPARSASHTEGTSWPMGETTPIPVSTARRRLAMAIQSQFGGGHRPFRGWGLTPFRTASKSRRARLHDQEFPLAPPAQIRLGQSEVADHRLVHVVNEHVLVKDPQ